MSEKSKIIGTLALGALAGIALVKLLESDKGQEFVASTKEKVKSTADDIKTKINQLEAELAELLKNQTENNSKA